MKIPTKPPYVLNIRASIIYEGRASSVLPTSDLIVMCKPDGAIAIHGASLTIPLNYMGPKTTQEIDGNIIVYTNKKETITLEVEKIYSSLQIEEWDECKIKIVKTESELKDKLADNAKKYYGFEPVKIIKEFRTDHGPVDLAFLDNDEGIVIDRVVHITEVKRKKITLKHCYQVIRYGDALKQSLAFVELYLAGPCISANALKYCEANKIKYVDVQFD